MKTWGLGLSQSREHPDQVFDFEAIFILENE
jgi:hypothetical protein